MKDPKQQAEFEKFWDEEAGKPASTISKETAKKISEKFDKEFHENLKKSSL